MYARLFKPTDYYYRSKLQLYTRASAVRWRPREDFRTSVRAERIFFYAYDSKMTYVHVII